MLEDATIGSLPLYHAWGILAAAAFAAVLLPVARRSGFRTRDTLAILAVALLALYAGSRLFFELVEFPLMPGRMWVRVPPFLERLPRPLGFTFLGGVALMGILAGALGLTPLVGQTPGRILDVLVPPTATGFVLMKAGCVLAGCCYGRPSGAWWSVTIPHMHTSRIETTVPVRFIEMGVSAALAGLALWALLGWPARRPRPGGIVFASYLAAASLARFGSGFLRGDYEVSLGGLHAVQWGALVLALAGAAWAVVIVLRSRGREA